MHPYFSSLLFFLLAGLTLCLTGCSLNHQSSHISGDNSGITLEFWTLQLQPFASTIQPILDRFEAQHPGVHVHWVDLPFNEGEKRVLSAILSPQPPDVVNLNPDFSALLASRGALVNMNTALAPAVRQRYLPLAWQAVTLSTSTDQEGIVFGLPWYLTSSVTIINQKLVQQAGFSDIPHTFEALPKFCQALHFKTGGYALMPAITEGNTWQKLLARANIPLFQADAGGKLKAVFADLGAGRFLVQWKQLYQQGLLPAELITEGHRAALDRFQSGSLAMLLSGANFLKLVQENAPAVFADTRVAPQFPQDSSSPPDFSAMLIAVTTASPHRAEALALAETLTNTVNQLALTQAAPVLPSTLEALKAQSILATANPALASSTLLLDEARRLSAQQLLSHASSSSLLSVQPRQQEINEILHNAVEAALLGKLDPETAMQQAQTAINKLLLDF